MSSLEEIRAERLKKLQILKDKGINPYPAEVNRSHEIISVLEQFSDLEIEKKIITIVGRVMVVRGQGAIMFVVLQDATGKLQVVFKEDVIPEESFSLFKDVVDGGDFIDVTGTLFVTQRGEKSLLVESWRMVTKSLLPLPDKYHGLQDEEERIRKRYLDLLGRDELRQMFKRKEKFWDVTRSFMKEQGFTEVETPTLEVTTGGAEARPFATHHNDFDIDVFLRISVGELWQKRLLSAGFEKIFEIGRVYRNEGTSPNHLQEFTNLEFYQAFADYEDGMRLVENLYRTIASEVYGTTKFTRGEHTFDLADEWIKVDYITEIKRQTDIDLLNTNEEEIKSKLNALGVKYEGDNIERLTDTLWKYCRKHIAGPAFLINHPKLVSPLAKEVVGQPGATQRFQPIIAGTEVGNGYSELNDPLEQKARFDLQQTLIERGDAEAMMPDFEFVEMLEHGMPPACGFGFGERLFAILEDKPIRETQLFPLMKSKDVSIKEKERKVAVAVYNTEANLESWQIANTIAHLGAELGVRGGKSLLKYDSIETSDGVSIPLNIQHPIMVKVSDTNEELKKLLTIARESNLQVAVFTREMLETTNDKKIKRNYSW
ncbi:MAG: Lysine--tRNA ligase [Parcubacteria bacterium OLB19]|nr:MAG: Lysine--tRNA ligase [Parcubacteria bacterium OLB19]